MRLIQKYIFQLQNMKIIYIIISYFKLVIVIVVKQKSLLLCDLLKKK